MCGIAGFNLSTLETIDAQALSKALLLAIEPRGTDASGAAWSDPSKGHNVWFQKSPVRARVLVGTLEVPPNARNVILHTRFATQGIPADNDNNHPISVPGIVGVHNGWVTNDDDLFAVIPDAKRIAQVDSEAIFAALAQMTGHATDILALVEGRAAVAWIELTKPRTLHLARVNGSPLSYTRTPKGSVIFASTPEMLRLACRVAKVDHGAVLNLGEYQYLKFRSGRLTETGDIPRPKVLRPKVWSSLPVSQRYGRSLPEYPRKPAKSLHDTTPPYRPMPDWPAKEPELTAKEVAEFDKWRRATV